MENNNPIYHKRKIVLVGIAGTKKDFLLAPPVLKAYLNQFENIKKSKEITLLNYPVDISSRNVLDDISKINPNIVGFSCYLWNNKIVREISEKLDKRITVVFGGPDISKEDVEKGRYDNINVDYIIFGEGEKAFFNLLNGMKSSNIKGLAYRNKKSFISNQDSDLIDDLASQPSALLTNSVPAEIFNKPEMRINIETQRGCSFRCGYCMYHKKFPSIRYRNPEVIVNEIEYAFKKGIKVGRIIDANFLSDNNFAKKIFQGLTEKKIRMRFNISLVSNFLTPEIMDLFENYVSISEDNSLLLDIGLQSLNKDSLTVINRIKQNNSIEKALNMVSRGNKRITANVDTILGLPYETKSSYFKTLDYLIEKTRSKNIFIEPFILKILPGTKLNLMSTELGLKIDKRDSEYNIYSTPAMTRKDMIYCQKMTTICYRLFSPLNDSKINGLYFEVKDTISLSNIQLFDILVNIFSEHLKETDSNFVKDDFPDAENYYYKICRLEITDQDLIKMLIKIKNNYIYANSS